VAKVVGRIGLALFCSAGWIFFTRALVRISSGHAIAEVMYAAGCLAAVGVVAWLRYTPAGREISLVNFETDWMGTVVVAMALVGFATAGFATVSTFLYGHGVGALGGSAVRGRAVADAAYAYYVWHLADVVPVLEVPKTLNWTLNHPFTDVAHGALTVAYKAMVGLPAAFAVAKLVTRWIIEPQVREAPLEPSGSRACGAKRRS